VRNSGISLKILINIKRCYKNQPVDQTLFGFENLASGTVEDPALRGSEREGSVVGWVLNGVLEWWSAGVLCKIPSLTGEQECLRIAMDKGSLQHHNLC
jgi:hypothetical protein